MFGREFLENPRLACRVFFPFGAGVGSKITRTAVELRGVWRDCAALANSGAVVLR